MTTATTIEPIPVAMTKPWAHQVLAYNLIRTQPGTMVPYDMGIGKSKIIVDIVVNLDECSPCLIICPSNVVDVWPAQFAKHAPDSNIEVVALREGTVAQRTEKAERALALAEARHRKIVIVINYEAAWPPPFGPTRSEEDQYRIKEKGFALSHKWGMVVADEIHRIKAPGGKFSWLMKWLSRQTNKRVGLSGTPMAHSPLDVYAQYRFLDPAIFGRSFVRFRSRYAVMGGYYNHETIGYQHQDELNEKFYSISAPRIKKSDVLDLPEVMHEERPVQLCPTAARIYKELEREFIADVGSGVVTASNALARLLRLQQLTSGFAVTEDGEHHQVDQSKFQALSDILEDLDLADPVVVFCRFKDDLAAVHRAAKQFDRRCLELSGRAHELAEWQGCEDGEVLAVQIQAGGLGVDLTRAAYCVYFSLGFSLGEYEQSLARLHRPGQERSVTYFHLVAEGTVDRKVYAALRERADVIEAILAQMKGRT